MAAVLVTGTGALVAALLAVSGAPAAGIPLLAGALVVRTMLVARAERSVAGARAEERVGDRLRRLRADAVLFGVRLPNARGDVDIVALGPMAAAVEVKLGVGWVRARADGRVLVQRRPLPGRPLRQAVAMAAATRRTAGIETHVVAVLCVSEMRQRPKLVHVDGQPVWLASARHLRRVLRRLPRELDRTAAIRAATRLAPR